MCILYLKPKFHIISALIGMCLCVGCVKTGNYTSCPSSTECWKCECRNHRKPWRAQTWIKKRKWQRESHKTLVCHQSGTQIVKADAIWRIWKHNSKTNKETTPGFFFSPTFFVFHFTFIFNGAIHQHNSRFIEASQYKYLTQTPPCPLLIAIKKKKDLKHF